MQLLKVFSTIIYWDCELSERGAQRRGWKTTGFFFLILQMYNQPDTTKQLCLAEKWGRGTLE